MTDETTRITMAEAETALAEAETAMYKARDVRTASLTAVRNRLHTLCCSHDIDDIEHPDARQALIELCSGACEVSEAYQRALDVVCESALTVEAARHERQAAPVG